MEIAYVDYNERVQVSFDALIVSLWNSYIEAEGKGRSNKISLNNKEFFENSFDNAYDAAFAESLSGKWTWSDDFVCFDEDGYLTSFSHWDDENSPIDIDKIDIGHLIDGLKNFRNKQDKQGHVDNNISRAIHDALK